MGFYVPPLERLFKHFCRLAIGDDRRPVGPVDICNDQFDDSSCFCYCAVAHMKDRVSTTARRHCREVAITPQE